MRVVLGVILFALFVLVVGKASGRVLGIRLGNARGALVGTIGWIAGVTAVAFTLDDSPRSGLTVHVDNVGQALGAAALVVFFGVLAAMPVAIGIDLLTRGAPVAKRRRGRWWLHPVRSLKAELAPYSRLREVIGNARRANLLHWRYATGAALDSPDLARRRPHACSRSPAG